MAVLRPSGRRMQRKEETMDVQLPVAGISTFMLSHIPEFLDRFGINFTIDGPQLEYFVYEKKSGLDISCSMTLGLEAPRGQIRVMTFYPGICMQQGARYLSSVCFFLVMHHFAAFHHLGSDGHILINTRQGIFDSFYARLKDFHFYIQRGGEEDRIDIASPFLPILTDTTMIVERPLVEKSAD